MYFFSLLFLSDSDFFIVIEMGYDFEEAYEKWEFGLFIVFEGWWERIY